jgi:hypothetical protein
MKLRFMFDLSSGHAAARAGVIMKLRFMFDLPSGHTAA